VTFILRFEPPLQVQGTSADGLIQRLTRLVSTSAQVIATGMDE